MTGTNTSTTHSISPSVRRLDTESHTVRLAAGTLDEGRTKGNMAAPAVTMIPASAADEATKAASVRRARARRRRAASPASSG